MIGHLIKKKKGNYESCKRLEYYEHGIFLSLKKLGNLFKS